MLDEGLGEAFWREPKWKRIPPQGAALRTLGAKGMLPAIWFIFSRRDCDQAALAVQTSVSAFLWSNRFLYISILARAEGDLCTCATRQRSQCRPWCMPCLSSPRCFCSTGPGLLCSTLNFFCQGCHPLYSVWHLCTCNTHCCFQPYAVILT